MPAKISDQISVYNMYMNVLERSGKIKPVAAESTNVQQNEESKETATTKVAKQEKSKPEKKKEKA